MRKTSRKGKGVWGDAKTKLRKKRTTKTRLKHWRGPRKNHPT